MNTFKFNLAQLRHKNVSVKNADSKEEKGMFIPFDQPGIDVFHSEKGNFFISGYINPIPPEKRRGDDKYPSTHLGNLGRTKEEAERIKNLSKEEKDELAKEGKLFTPTCMQIRMEEGDFHQENTPPEDNSIGGELTPDDDLPF